MPQGGRQKEAEANVTLFSIGRCVQAPGHTSQMRVSQFEETLRVKI